MKTVGKIIACLTAACLLLGLMTVIRMSPDLLSEDTVAVDSASAVYDEQALYEELFAPDSVVRIDVNMPRSEMAKMQQDFRYYRAQKVRSPIYRKADSVTITVNGKKYMIEEVGLRLKGSTFSWDPSGSSLTAVSPFSTYNYSFQSEQENPLLMMFLEPDGFFRDKYEQALRRVYDSGWLTEEHYLPYYESARRRYGDRVISGWHFMNTLGRNTDFTMEGGSAGNGNMAVGEFFDKMRANAAPYLAGIPPVSASDC